MNENKWAYLSWAIKNSVVMICWAAITIYFGEWWVMLFAAFFVNGLKVWRSPTRFICDRCGRELPFEGTYAEAVLEKKKAGWSREREGDTWVDICKECQRLEAKPVFSKRQASVFDAKPFVKMGEDFGDSSSTKN